MQAKDGFGFYFATRPTLHFYTLNIFKPIPHPAPQKEKILSTKLKTSREKKSNQIFLTQHTQKFGCYTILPLTNVRMPADY